jgi:undecaprenyl-diphosphatase
MGLLQAIVMGIVQGLSEYLPISSSGHLFITEQLGNRLFGWKVGGAGFTAVIQIGTLIAVFLYFWNDIKTAFNGWVRGLYDRSLRDTPEYKMGWAVFLGSIPIAIIGFLLKDQIEGPFRNGYVVAGSLILFALLLGLAERQGKQEKGYRDFTPMNGLLMGFYQCLALIPGSSRSGCSIMGGLFMGFDRATAARTSFLLSIPAILGSGFYGLIKHRAELLDEGLMPTLTATAVSGIVGFLAIKFLMGYLQRKSTAIFIWYRLALGLVVIGLTSAGFLDSHTPSTELKVSVLEKRVS